MAWIMISVLKSMLRDARGATTIEYGLILALIFLAIVGAVAGLGGENGGQWGNMSTKAATAMAGAAG
ncbi:MAG: Flp family type IVb pilin [Sphingomonadales bacterium]|nr:Flp family type IVb pilin [Sphingomonadales bacterium]